MPTPLSDVTFAILGDVEPKPHPNFDHLASAMRAINRMQDGMGIQFVASVGDLVHSGKMDHFRIVTDIVATLTVPFYFVLGNEELAAEPDVYGHYAQRWNADVNVRRSPVYAVHRAGRTFIFATAMGDGVTLAENEANELAALVAADKHRPAVVFTHAPPPGVFARARNRTMRNDLVADVFAQPSVAMHVSGHTHFDLDTVAGHATDGYGVHYVHAPGIARTKVGANHTPRFRVVHMQRGGNIIVHTYNIETECFEERHRLTLPARNISPGAGGSC